MKGEVLKKIIKDSGISLAVLSSKLDISPQLLQNWLSVDELKLDKIEKIMNAMGDSVNISVYEEYPILKNYKKEELTLDNQDYEIMKYLIDSLKKQLEDKETIIQEKERLIQVLLGANEVKKEKIS